MFAVIFAIDSIANVVAAISAILLEIASCFQIGSPHCERTADHPLTISRQRLDDPTQAAGSERRPVLSVVSAILRPCPSPPIRFSLGTRTSWKEITPLASAFSPMK